MSESLRLHNASQKITQPELKKSPAKPELVPFSPKLYSRDVINRFHQDFTPDRGGAKKPFTGFGLIGLGLALLSLVLFAHVPRIIHNPTKT